MRDEKKYLDHVDPRLRVIVAVAWAVLMAVVQDDGALAAATAAAAGACFFASLPRKQFLKRLLTLNAVLLLIAGLMALGSPGEMERGLLLGLKIALKANAIVLAVTALLGTMEAAVLGHALHHLRVPAKLVHLLLLTVRYLEVLRQEHRRLHAAMLVRGFRPRMDRHTYRTYGYLAGMLLVRSVSRAERILAAMRCRGFRGRFYLLDHFTLSPRDLPFCITALAAGAGVIAWAWWC
jgi:cobalt/nickel transport system permease protein